MTRPSIEVLETVAAAEGLQTAELDCVLGDVVDPDALDRLAPPSLDGADHQGLTVTFDYCGYTVTVGGGIGRRPGVVSLEGRENRRTRTVGYSAWR